jgi:hypothetical protein
MWNWNIHVYIYMRWQHLSQVERGGLDGQGIGVWVRRWRVQLCPMAFQQIVWSCHALQLLHWKRAHDF